MTEALAPLKSPYPEGKEDNLSYLLSDLTAFDITPVDPTCDLDSISRDNIQLLVNRIFGLPVQHGDSGPCAILPTDSKVPGVEIPREKPLPKPKQKTRWEKFAEQKGMNQKEKRGRMVWDDITKDWVPRWGFGSKKQIEDKHNWIVEVGEGDDPHADPWEKKRLEKRLEQSKQTLRENRNKLEGAGLRLPAGISGSVDLSKRGKRGPENLKESLARSQVSTASVGKFDKAVRNEDKLRIKKRTKVKEISASAERAANAKIAQRILRGDVFQPDVKVDKTRAAKVAITQEQRQRRKEKAEEGGGKKKSALMVKKQKRGMAMAKKSENDIAKKNKKIKGKR